MLAEPLACDRVAELRVVERVTARRRGLAVRRESDEACKAGSDLSIRCRSECALTGLMNDDN